MQLLIYLYGSIKIPATDLFLRDTPLFLERPRDKPGKQSAAG
jgi:hypothetical protein